jgi:hypothetical protein
MELPLEQQATYGYLVELRKGPMGDLHTERSVHADDVDGVANVVEGFRTHAVQADSVRWESDRIVTGSCKGLAPLGVVYEIAVTPAITLDA